MSEFKISLRNLRLEVEEGLSTYQVEHLHKVVKKIAKTAGIYAVTREPPEVVVAAAKSRSLLSVTGLMGSLSCGGDTPFAVFQRAEAEYTSLLEERVRQVQAEHRSDQLFLLEKPPMVPTPIRNSCLRASVSAQLDSLAKDTISQIYRLGYELDSPKINASSVVERSFEAASDQTAALKEALKLELVEQSGEELNVKSGVENRTNAIMQGWSRDVCAGLLQEIIESRAKRTKNAPNP